MNPPVPTFSPVYAGALDAHGDSQVDGGPTRLLLPAVAALLVPGATEGHSQGRGLVSGGARRAVPTAQDGGGLFRLLTGRGDRYTGKRLLVLKQQFNREKVFLLFAPSQTL